MPKFHLDRRLDDLIEKVRGGNPNEILTTDSLAVLLGVSAEFLSHRRTNKDGPQFTRVPPRSIVYRRGDVTAWLRERREALDAAAA